MITKYFLNGKEIDVYVVKDNSESPLVITESMLKLLLDFGKIEAKKFNSTLHYYQDKVENKIGKEAFAKLCQKYPSAVIGMILKEIAIELDSAYPNHISKSTYIFVIATSRWEVVPILKSSITNYKGFAAFRTVADAQYALDIVKPLIYSMCNDK